MGVDSLELQPSTPEVQLPGVSSPSSWGVTDSDWWELQDSGPEAVHTGRELGRAWAYHESRSVADKATSALSLLQTCNWWCSLSRVNMS